MSLRTFHLRGHKGALAAIYYPPVGKHDLGDVLVAPAFAEEMNRCRAMVAMQARAFMDRGIGTLVLDPYGTGDSEGEFSEGSWELWRDDLRSGIEWLRREGRVCRTIWGVRLGAIMAVELAAADPQIDQVLLWQPVIDAKAFYTQFLRIRVAAELEQKGGIKSTDELRRMSARGESIEVSGYRIGPQLASELDSVCMPEAARIMALRVLWLEVLPATDSSISRANSRATDAYRAAGVHLELETVIGPSFWQVHERVAVPELIAGTNRLLTGDAKACHQSIGPMEHGTAPLAHRSMIDGDDVPSPAHGGALEYGTTFPCEGEQLTGVIHHATARRGVVIVVAGGPQYRAGAHRQFVLLARKLAALGYPVLRFDLRGMGDSSGEYLGFQHSKPDICAAIDALLEHESTVDEVVLFGECESASGILFFAYEDERVKGLVLVNPWVRTEGGRAEVIVKHYYANRLLSRDFWRKVSRGEFELLQSLHDLLATVRAYLHGLALRRQRFAGFDNEQIDDLPLPTKTAVALRRFRGPVMILMSGRDYIAREFDEVVKSSKAWSGLLSDRRVHRRDIPEADHTFSREVWKRQASDWICQWVASW